MSEWPPNPQAAPPPPPEDGDNEPFAAMGSSEPVPVAIPPTPPPLRNAPSGLDWGQPPVQPPVQVSPNSDSQAGPSDEPHTSRRRRFGLWVAGMAAAVALIAGGLALGSVVFDDDSPSDRPVTLAVEEPPTADVQLPAVRTEPPTPIPVQPGPVTEEAPEPVAAVAAAVAPAVVRIDTGVGTGSGIIYDESGLLVTNAHVVGDVVDVTVQFADGTRSAATVVGSDPAVDVAVVQITDDVDFEVAVFAPTSTVEVGQLAVAIGSPFGLENSVTAGIISAVNRALNSTNVADGSPTVVEMVQTDAPINPGNSGGALADRQGRIVGMNTSIRTDGTVQGNLGVGFAIPSDTVLLIAGRIVAGDPLDSGFLGLSGLDPADGQPGALVSEVVEGGPAEAGGLLTGDLITSIGGESVLGMGDLAAKVRLSTPGTTLTMMVEREGEPVELTITLGTLGQ